MHAHSAGIKFSELEIINAVVIALGLSDPDHPMQLGLSDPDRPMQLGRVIQIAPCS